jgi:hypothetical protein
MFFKKVIRRFASSNKSLGHKVLSGARRAPFGLSPLPPKLWQASETAEGEGEDEDVDGELASLEEMADAIEEETETTPPPKRSKVELPDTTEKA